MLHGNPKFVLDRSTPPIVYSWRLLVEANQQLPGLLGHSNRVSRYASLLGKQVGLDSTEQDYLQQAALLHDIGKIYLPKELLTSALPLNDQQRSQIQEHPQLGTSVIESLGFQEPVASAVLHHHERWDGGGYPIGRSETDIPISARILAVVDTFDAITTERPYRAARSQTEACQELERVAGTQLDPHLVTRFLRLT